MRIRELTHVELLKTLGVDGMVIYPFVCFAEAAPSKQLKNHEGIHVQQILRDGVWTFYVTYLWEYVEGRLRGLGHDKSYRAISYEKEAYQNHHNLEYKVL